MTLQRLFKWGLCVLGVITLLASCDNGCQNTRENFMHVTFVSTSGRTLTKLQYTAYSDTISVTETGITSFSDIELDLNPSKDSVLYVFTCTYTDYGDTYVDKDSVLVKYAASPKFIDMACGATMLYDLQDVQGLSQEFITRISVNEPSILPENNGKINITFEY